MFGYYIEDVVMFALAIFILAIVALGVVATVVTIRAEPTCFDNGYQDVSITWKLDAYCLKYDEYGRTVMTPIEDL